MGSVGFPPAPRVTSPRPTPILTQTSSPS
ncbi:hypothetical protein CCACVL1_14363, partial [Corchorus capsularis]